MIAPLRPLILALALGAPAMAGAASIPVLPSGQKVTLLQVVWPAPGVKHAIARFRFLAPQIGPGKGQVDGDRAQDDMDLLCSAYALPEVKAHGGQVDQVVISLSQKPLALGTREPDVVHILRHL